MEVSEFMELSAEARKRAIGNAAASGPSYPPKPLRWGQQVFEHDITPAGEVTCKRALRVGKTNNRLDILLIACHDVEEAVQFSGGASITLTMLSCETEDGEFRPEGPSICIVAPEEGISAEADDLLARFAIGNRGQYLKPVLKFDGAITGGKLNCCLGYMPS